MNDDRMFRIVLGNGRSMVVTDCNNEIDAIRNIRSVWTSCHDKNKFLNRISDVRKIELNDFDEQLDTLLLNKR
jgi:hypothetical protein